MNMQKVQEEQKFTSASRAQRRTEGMEGGEGRGSTDVNIGI